MTQDDSSNLDDSLRGSIIQKQRKKLDSSEVHHAVLALALTIGFFGSSAVLMPSQESVTGMFSGQTDLQQPRIQGIEVRSQEFSNNEISFVLDSRVFNPNIVGAETKTIDYDIVVDGETVKRGEVVGSTSFRPKDAGMSAVEYELDVSGISNSQEFVSDIRTGEADLVVEGTMSFNVAEQHFEAPFRYNAVL